MIPLAVPNLGPKEREYVVDAVASGWVGPDGPYVKKFEEMVAEAAQRKWAVAVTTGSDALRASAIILGLQIKKIDISEEAFPAARNVFGLLGCKISTKHGDENHDEAFYPAEVWPVMADRAPAIGEPRTDATLECYSFAANKTVTCGQGGAIVGDDIGLGKIVREWVRQGYGRVGLFNLRMSNLNAALGCAQMERLSELKEAKRRIWNRYKDAGLPMVERGASRWMSTVRWKNGLIDRLEKKDIQARDEPSGISIPCSTHLTEQDQDKVIEACLEYFRSEPIDQTLHH